MAPRIRRTARATAHRRAAVLLTLPAALAWSGCASHQPPPPSSATTQERTRLDASNARYDFETTSRATVVERRIAAPIERVWSVLPTVFDSLGIPMGLADSRTHVYGNRAFKAQRQLAGMRLSRLVDCGRSATGFNADRYQVTLSVVITLATAPDGSTSAYIAVEGRATDPGVSGDPVRCSTTGQLEDVIAERLAARLQSRVDAIVLERTSCFGVCPAYRLRVERSGLVTFERQNGRDAGRTERDSIAPSAFLSLVAMAERAGVDALPDRIEGDARLCPVRATDHPTVRIVLTGQNVTRRIDHYTGCYLSPELAIAEPLRQLTAFEAAVDSVAGVRRWIH